MNILIKKKDIGNYLILQEPYIMIDNLIKATEEGFVTDFEISPDNIFLEERLFREYGMIENIAQSGAVGLVFMNSESQNGIVDGFLVGISKLNVHGLPGIADRILTTVKPMAYYANMVMLKGEIKLNNRLLLDCEIKLVGNERLEINS